MQWFKYSVVYFVLLVYASSSVFSQQFGGNPPSLKWKQIRTDSVRVIFPVGLGGKASSIASIASQLGITQPTLGNRFRRINIVLQNQTTISNGYVGLGPRRSEFYLNPLQNSFELGSLPWHEQLALHEFRHVQQYNNFNKGISKLFYALAGEYGLVFANATAIPNWFWEGDAVFQETQQSLQGRGRLPYFFNGYRSLWAASKDYSWMKLRNGSLRDYVPNHYQLGYLLVAYGREKYGDSIWGKVTNDAARFKPLIYPFQGAFRRNTGQSFTKFTQEAIRFYQSQMKDSVDEVNSLSAKQKHFIADEEFPQWISEYEIVFVKSSYREIPRFVIRNIQSGKESVVRNKDISLDNYFSAKKDWLVYAALSYDARWGWRDFSDIRLLNIRNGIQHTITSKSKLFSPDISDDGEEIATIQQNTDGSNALVIINREGKQLQKFDAPLNYLYTYPKFQGPNRVVVAVRNDKGEMNISVIDRNTGTRTDLLSNSMNVIGFPTVEGEAIYFTASDGDQDQLFKLEGGRLMRFSPSRQRNKSTGSYGLTVKQNQAAWFDFSSTGFRLRTEAMQGAGFVEAKNNQLVPLPVFGIKSLYTPPSVSNPTNDSIYRSKHFSKGFRLFNFHSWLPTISDPDYTLTLISENLINTLQTDVYFNYNTNEDSKKIGFVTAYGALYPWIRAAAAYTRDRRFTYSGNLVYWNEAEVRAGVLIPWNFSKGLFYRYLRFGTDYVHVKPEFQGRYKDTFDSRAYGYINSYLSFSNQVQMARQHIYPRFAQSFRIDYNKGITKVDGNQLLLSGLLYFPGFFTNHSIVVNAAWQKRDTARQIRFTNSFPFSRGYLESNFDQQQKIGVNYHLPLFYPDWGFGNIVYFLRVRANAFYDHSFTYTFNNARKKVNRDFRSYGGEIYFDTKWWNQQPISFGFRYSRLLDAAYQNLSPNQFEFVLPVNLINR